MPLHSFFILLGSFCAVALLGVCAGMILLRLQIRSSVTRDRALPMGKQPVNPAFWDGKTAQDRARAAADEVTE